MVLEKVKDTVKRYNLIAKGDKILVAVSGGPDSVALLYLLNSLKRELNLKLHIAHLDHELRKDSFKDKIFVENLARKLKLPVTTAGINIRQLSTRGGSLEEIARNARLGFLFKVAKDMESAKIALGHNLDDQAETVLMRILRGAGLYGLAGISPKKRISGYEIIRPLIEIRRSEIEAYLKKKKIKPRLDKSNLQDIYFRNKIRNRLMPLLEKGYNKNIREVLSNMAQGVACDYDYLLRCAERRMKGLRSRLNLRRLKKMHPALQRIMLRMTIAKIKGDTRRITFQHIKEIEDLIYNRPARSIVDLPQGVSVIKSKNYLSFFRKAKSSINT